MIDAVIVGAGVIGASVAYWLTRAGASVVLVERDTSFASASSALSASSIRQQFSSPVNIRMSLFGAQFLRDIGIALEAHGYLYLGDEAALQRLHRLQTEQGADVALLTRADLSRRFPWLNVEDVEAGTLGLSGEGWFDGPALHTALLARARSQGAKLVRGEVFGFDIGQRVNAVLLTDGTRLECRHAVDAAGPWARRVAAMADINLPVHARRRTVFVVSCPQHLNACPLVVDPSGFWFRPEGRRFIAGAAPRVDEDELPLEPDLLEFDHGLWEGMAHRVPAFEALRVERAWAGYYEMNVFDHNAIIGAHPRLANLWFANGFSGHGMQHAPAAGRGVAELVLHGAFATMDLSALGFQRLVEGRPMRELNVIG